jgi:hypothetical protein
VPVEWRKRDVLGLLVTTQKATRGVLEMMGMNRWPMGFLKVSNKGVVEQFVWNRSAIERGLEGMGVTVRYGNEDVTGGEDEGGVKEEKEKRKIVEAGDEAKMKRRKAKKEKATIRRDIQLTWLGKPIFADRDSLDEKTIQLGEEISCINQKPDAEEKILGTKGQGEGEKKRAKSGPKEKESDAVSIATKTPRTLRKTPVASITEAHVRKLGRPRKFPVEEHPIKTRVRRQSRPM